MKKRYLLVVLILLVFFISGCEDPLFSKKVDIKEVFRLDLGGKQESVENCSAGLINGQFQDTDGDGCHAGLDSDCGNAELVLNGYFTCGDNLDTDCDGMIDYADDDGTCGNPPIFACNQFQYCLDNTCKLDNGDYGLGLVYIYTNEENYNSNWRTEFEDIIEKVEESINQTTEGKINFSIEILGESIVETYSWNPAKIGVKCDDIYHPLPGSSFAQEGFELTCESTEIINCSDCKVEEVSIPNVSEGNQTCNLGIEDWETLPGQCNPNFLPFFCDGGSGELILDCTRCGCDSDQFCDDISGSCFAVGFEENHTKYLVSINSSNGLSYENLFENGTYYILLKSEIASNLDFNFDDYDGVFIIFGRLGIPLMSEPHFYDYKCRVSDDIIGGYSSLIMGEDAIKSGGLVDCALHHPTESDRFYYRTGWHMIAHEILHNIGAVDVYDTSLSFGIASDREISLLIDSRTDESIMGNDEKPCMIDFSCNSEDLDEVYLDKYNRFNIGLNIDTIGMTDEVLNILSARNRCACGDGFLEGPNILGMYEECDDGNRINTDACTNECKPATANDGICWGGMERCGECCDLQGECYPCNDCVGYPGEIANCDENEICVGFDTTDGSVNPSCAVSCSSNFPAGCFMAPECPQEYDQITGYLADMTDPLAGACWDLDPDQEAHYETWLCCALPP